MLITDLTQEVQAERAEKSGIPSHVPEIMIPSREVLRREHITFFLTIVTPFVGTIGAVLFFRYRALTMVDLGLFLASAVLTLVGVEVGNHRLFSHHAFQPRQGLKVALAILGACAIQGPTSYWVAHHRRHHQFSDNSGNLQGYSSWFSCLACCGENVSREPLRCA